MHLTDVYRQHVRLRSMLFIIKSVVNMDGVRSGKQIYLRARNPNPLFQSWLERWLLQAQQKDSPKQFVLKKALESLKKYPLVLQCGRSCSILDGFGKGLCAALDKELNEYRAEHPAQRIPNERDVELKEQTIIEEVRNMLEEKDKEMTGAAKLDLVKHGHEKSSDKKSDPFEELFSKYGHLVEPEKYKSEQKVTQSSPPSKRKCFDFEAPEIRLRKGFFKIVLLVDTQETAGKSKRSLDATIQGLIENQIEHEVRKLSVGDFLWICKDTSGSGHELVLPYIIERKRMDDLASSIKDGRFREQKFRLTKSGIPNVIYLIESRGNNSHLGLPIQTLLQASINAQIHDQFSVKYTDSHKDSILYLSIMTQLIFEIIQNADLIDTEKSEIDQLGKKYYADLSTKKEVKLMNFNHFNASTMKMKNFTIRDLFMRQLIQLKTLTVEKAVAITEVYPTPSHLFKKYRECQSKEQAENLLTLIKYGKLKKNIGPTISKIIYDLYNL